MCLSSRVGCDRNEHVQYYENGVIRFKHDKIHVIYGEIFNKWQTLGGLKVIRYPVSNEQEIVDVSNNMKIQKFQKGQQEGAIYLVNGTAYYTKDKRKNS